MDGTLDGVVATIWNDDCGNVAWHSTQLFKAGALKHDPQVVFRELLAMSIGHSKSRSS
jgi:hypothetical protein